MRGWVFLPLLFCSSDHALLNYGGMGYQLWVLMPDLYTVVYTCMISITHIHTTAHTPTKLHIRIYSLQVEIFEHEYTLYFHRLPIFRNTGIYQPMLENDIFGELEKIYRQFDETGKILLFSIHQEYRFNPHTKYELCIAISSFWKQL